MTPRTVFLGALAALALGTATPCFAQGAGSDLSPEQRTRIRNYIVTERVAPVTVPDRMAVGTRLPADVELRTVPGDWGPSVSRYRYIYSDNHVYFVDPSSREVVLMME